MHIRKITESDLVNSPNLEPADLNKWALFIENTLVFFSPNKDAVTDMKDSIRRSFPEKG
jgi:hypothetical protein